MEVAIFLIIFTVLAYFLSRYLYHVALLMPAAPDKVFGGIERLIYKLIGTELMPMSGKTYVKHFLLFNACMGVVSFILLTVQQWLFLNPNGNLNQSMTLAFNTAASFLTNTNLQHYAGESGLTYLTQMIVITYLMFTSSASGYAVCIAMLRRLTGVTDVIGNFYQDVVRFIVRVLIPLSFIVSIFLISQGTPQTFKGNLTIETLSGSIQRIAYGPIASLESIKHIGTNGGGFLGANSSTPFENPTIWTNYIEMLSMMMIPGALVFLFGRMLMKNGRHIHRHAYVIFGTMAAFFLMFFAIAVVSEIKGNPVLHQLGIAGANMEGKEVRFGPVFSALFTTVTTAFTTGTVNNMHDSLTPLGGLTPLVLMMLNAIFGGEGVGLMNMLIYVMLTVFLCSLMVGKTPDYLGMKIEAREMKLIALTFLIHPLLILIFSALAFIVPGASDAITNPSFHGVSQVLYEMTSASANNGSGFEGLADDTPFWNIATGVVMLLARYVPIVLQIMIASSLVNKKTYQKETETIQLSTPFFGMTLFIFIVLLSGLTFLPVLLLGPIGEFLSLR
ncbi:potassium-transporting ATPase subunit A [Staphylococcus felis]|uniref:potassium-transporting ATPase subunit KdpA n=1 Tax=Staphylococcus felis TaxID=46127 RepID=UPI000E248B2E|nr:potassium-transporting ATPase subunit KdpA [Staphylococcus felis]REH98050.1 potassium-transporting ATPase subunit A [Staphylococcus felis]REI01309.1 potassium-transporting ATPase subunit A [Staphylococcus felis]REI10511.1 potassium-transporting ATPase subunit A [Staphylococcus felis]REI25740.1 potassium-transporting ATPase subunit A [Staphylococcus felis]